MRRFLVAWLYSKTSCKYPQPLSNFLIHVCLCCNSIAFLALLFDCIYISQNLSRPWNRLISWTLQYTDTVFLFFIYFFFRNPMQCWKSWLGHHKNMEQHDPLNFCPPTVRHETKGGNHPSKEDHKMLSECVSTNHNYDYITNPLIAKGCRTEDKSYLYSKRSAFGRDVSLDKSEYATLLKAECKRLIQETVPGNRVHKFHTI